MGFFILIDKQADVLDNLVNEIEWLVDSLKGRYIIYIH